jgi:hypothetical protein
MNWFRGHLCCTGKITLIITLVVHQTLPSSDSRVVSCGATTTGRFMKVRFTYNRFSDNKPWPRRGIFEILLQVTQYRAGAIADTTIFGELVLQCEPCLVEYYVNRGFAVSFLKKDMVKKCIALKCIVL